MRLGDAMRGGHRSMHGALTLAASAVLCVLAGCGASGDDSADQELSGEALEMAARERDLFGALAADPVGIFERRQGDARDRMCVVPDASGAYRFAAELQAKNGGSCLTGGTISPSDGAEEGDPRQWRVIFQGLDHCAVNVTEQGDQLIFPAHMPASCSALCAGRVNLAGAELDRTSWSEEEARILRLRRADGRMERACAA